jgi:hypothetical protein
MSPKEKEIVSLLSEVKYPDDLIDTVYENGNVLKTIGLPCVHPLPIFSPH